MGLSWVSYSTLIYTSELILCSTETYLSTLSLKFHYQISLRDSYNDEEDGDDDAKDDFVVIVVVMFLLFLYMIFIRLRGSELW